MGIIRQLDYETAMLVAAGEVIERPASVVKEILENSIDSGADKITLEIQKGGASLIRCTDNGCGIAKEDLPLSIMRNATSKIKTADDIAKILTLGFRGEALASVAAVSDLRIRSKRPCDDVGAELEIHPGDEPPNITEFPMTNGTTVISENLFVNVPARRKFLKKDSSEAAHITDLFERIALSHPNIAMTLIIDGKTKYTTPGNSNLQNAIYSIYGANFANKLIPLDYGNNLKIFGGSNVDIKVKGFIGSPDNTHGTRQNQIFYINNRNVRSKCLQSALEQGFVSYMESSRFPACVMFVEMPPEFVDVNIHPTKMEVKFVADKPVFEAVYYAVRGALERSIPRPGLEIGAKNAKEATYELYKQLNAFVPITDKTESVPKPVYNNQRNVKVGQISFDEVKTSLDEIKLEPLPEEPALKSEPSAKPTPSKPQPTTSPLLEFEMKPKAIPSNDGSCNQEVYLEAIPPSLDALMTGNRGKQVEPQKMYLSDIPEEIKDCPIDTVRPEGLPPEGYTHEYRAEPAASSHAAPIKKTPPFYKILGEAFLSYLFVEVGDRVMIIDKHAAHERIIFEDLKANMKKSREANGTPSQLLIAPLEIKLTPTLMSAALDFADEITAVGFTFEVGESHTVYVSSIPVGLEMSEAIAVFETIVERITLGTGSAAITRDTVFEKALYQASCKAAIKIGREYDTEHLKWICDRILALDDIKVCPHGRPVAIELTKNSIEHQFKRI